MKLKFSNISEIIITIFLSLWAFDILKLFFTEQFIHTGSKSEYVSIIIDIAMSMLFWAYLVKNIASSITDSIKKHKRKEKVFNLGFGNIVLGAFLCAILFNIVYKLLTGGFSFVSPKDFSLVLFSPTFLIIDIILITLAALTWGNSENIFLKALLSKNILILFTYTLILSWASLYNASVTNYETKGHFLPSSFLCKSTYTKYNAPLSLDTVPCPNIGKTDKDSLMMDASEGSYVAYIMALPKIEDNKDKIEMARAFYRNNDTKFSKSIWIEDGDKNTYEKSDLKRAKDSYNQAKTLDLSIIKLFEENKSDEIASVKKMIPLQLQSPLLKNIK